MPEALSSLAQSMGISNLAGGGALIVALIFLTALTFTWPLHSRRAGITDCP